jgi:Protein of unknown function (DUF2950)
LNDPKNDKGATVTIVPSNNSRRKIAYCLFGAALTIGSLTLARSTVAAQDFPRTFPTPDDAARELIRVVEAGNLAELIAIFGRDGQALADGSDPATGRKNRQVFTAAAAEGWRLVDQGSDRKTLVIGNEGWPFPVPIVHDKTAWRFDTAAGKEEVVVRRIGRNELAVIETCRAYVAAQRRYAQQGHDGKPAGRYAKSFHSEPGKENGLYWPAARGQKRSPLGDLVTQAAAEERPIGTNAVPPSTFHGYYFKILNEQGPAAPGGAKSYVVNGDMSDGFALVAWPAQYDVTGVMTFIVNHDGILYQKDLGSGTESVAKSMTRYNPDQSWRPVTQQPN